MREEAQVIALGVAMGVDLLLSDKRETRIHAKKLRLKVTGALGILPKAKKKG